MNFPRINLKSVLGILGHVKKLPLLFTYLKAAQEYVKLFKLIGDGLKTPACNFIFELRKAVKSLEERANKVDLDGDGDPLNDIDDGIYEHLDDALEQILEYFHLTDEYNELVKLDKAVG